VGGITVLDGRSHGLATVATAFVATVCLLASAGCGGKPAASKPASHRTDEALLNTVVLDDKQTQRLGIQLAEVEELLDLKRTRIVGGELVVPPGQTMIVSTPVAGTLAVPASGHSPPAGSELAQGEHVFRFTPLLSPERDVLTPAERIRVAESKAQIATAQIEAERAVESAKVQVEAAQIALDRAEALLETNAGSQRSLDAADAALRLAKESQAAAESRHRFLANLQLDAEAGEQRPWTVEAPVSGVLASLDAVPGATVAAGAPLFRIARHDPLWIRVPVYVGWWRDIDTQADAAVEEYGQAKDEPQRTASYVSAPPSADPVAASVDLFYLLGNADRRFRPGQRLAVTLTLKSVEKSSLAVPRKAVLYDIHGGAWVYENTAPHTYVRRRVEVKYVDQQQRAILSKGPPKGAKVITDGAAEVFGEEFGVGH
jgi:RND family efflux transporter MFP subunit